MNIVQNLKAKVIYTTITFSCYLNNALPPPVQNVIMNNVNGNHKVSMRTAGPFLGSVDKVLGS